MAAVSLTVTERRGLRDEAEHRVGVAVNRAIKDFLRIVVEGPRSQLVASAAYPEETRLGEMYGWWMATSARVIEAVREEWSRVYAAQSDGSTVTSTSLDGLDTYMAQVHDRLVHGLEPPLPEDAFDKVRIAVVAGAARGWSRARTAEHIAKVLSWSPTRDYWQGEYDAAGEAIDDLLDAVGPPGHPVREMMRQNDPEVSILQAQRAEARAQLDRDESYWQVRASRIARTEATGAHGFASMRALADEGWARKGWVATDDPRTRHSHALADGQAVAVLSPFLVGGVTLMFPGDPSAPAHEVINCRCTIEGRDAEEDSLVAAGSQPRDGDGDGWIDDGKPTMRPAPPKRINLDKWRGKPPPQPPKRPTPPPHKYPQMFDRWIEKVREHYAANPQKQEPWAKDWLDTCPDCLARAGSFMPEDLAAEGKELFDQHEARVKDAAEKADYEGALLRYDRAQRKHRADLRQWKQANGGDVLSGMTYSRDTSDLRETDEWLKRDFTIPGIAPGEKNDYLYSYSRQSALNTELRAAALGYSPLNSVAAGHVREIDSTMRPLDEDLIVYRLTNRMEFSGMGPYADQSALLNLRGTIYTQPGYTSTTVGRLDDKSVNLRGVIGDVHLRIKVPAGHRAVYMEPHTYYGDEYELLLARDTRFFVHDVRFETGSNGIGGTIAVAVIDVEVIPEGLATEAVTAEGGDTDAVQD